MSVGFSRADRSRLAQWWFTVDRPLLTTVFALYAIGLVVSLAASPAVALKMDLDLFHFVERHLVFALAGALIMLAISLLDPRSVRRLALIVLIASLAGMAYALAVGPDWNGSRRWLRLPGLTFQPSEFAKPAFVVVIAVLLAERDNRPGLPLIAFAIGLFALLAVLLRLQPDLAQTLLISAVFAAMLVVGGLPLIVPAAFAGCAAMVLAIGYLTTDYVARRIDAFLSGELAVGAQSEQAMRSFISGGFFGQGPGAGSIKTTLPDAHTDFIFAVIAEEYGAVFCLALVALYAFITLRIIARAIAMQTTADRFALIGLAVLFAAQTLIHMAVNVGLAPATGMTLPLISSGGSSLIAISVTLGMVLALARGKTRVPPLKPQAFAVKPGSLNTFEEPAGEQRR